MAAKKTSAQLAREVEKKYGVIPSPWWMNLCGSNITIDGIIVETGHEFVFKCSETGLVCGAGITEKNGLLKFSACYGLDRRVYEVTGEITGLKNNEKIKIYDGKSGKEYDYHPVAIYTGSYSMVILTQLWSI